MTKHRFRTPQQWLNERRRRKRRIALLLVLLAFVAAGSSALSLHGRTLSRRGIALGEAEQRASAVHEAGHVVVGLAVIPDPLFLSASVRTEFREDGLLGQAVWVPRIQALTATELRQEMARLCGGRAADVLMNGAPTEGASRDLLDMTERAKAIHFRYGLGPTLAVREPLGPDDWLRIEAEMRAACLRAERVIAVNKDLVVAVADLIMSKPEVDGEKAITASELYDFFIEKGAYPLEPEEGTCVPNTP